MDSFEIFNSIIERTVEQVGKSRESSTVRLDIIDAVKRKWISNLESLCGKSSDEKTASLAVNRAKYMTYPGSVTTRPEEEKITAAPLPVAPVASDDDDFEDDFGDAEIIHTTEAGRKMAETVLKTAQPTTSTTASIVRRVAVQKKKEISNPEDIDDDSLNEVEYDNILEPSDCAVRVFGQTEVCETVVGPRRSDSRWIVTILNGIVKTPDGKETLFRTAKQVMPHLHQHQ